MQIGKLRPQETVITPKHFPLRAFTPIYLAQISANMLFSGLFTLAHASGVTFEQDTCKQADLSFV